MYVIGETNVALQIKRNLFNQKFPSRLAPAKKGMKRVAISDNRLQCLSDDRYRQQLALLGREQRKSLTALDDDSKIDHSVWMHVPLFATMGVSERANDFYKNTVHQSLAQLRKSLNNNPSEDIEEIINFYEGRMTPCLFLNICQALLHSLMFGYAIGVLNIPQAKMMREFNVSDSQFAWLNAVFALGCVPGALIAGALSDHLGRKTFLIINDILWIICGFVFYLVVDYHAYIVARFFVGLAAGGASVVVPTFLGEISPVLIRGAVGSSVQLCICLGILISQFIAKWVDWVLVLALGSSLAAIQLCSSWTFMESPAWLLWKDQEAEAVFVLRELRSRRDVDFEIQMLNGANDQRDGNSIALDEATSANKDDGLAKPLLVFGKSRAKPQSFRQKLASRVELKWALLISIVLLVAQQFSGINSVFFYSASVFRDAGIDAWQGTVLASAANVIGVIIALNLVENLGRKMCLILSGTFMIIASICLILGLKMDEKHDVQSWHWFTIGACMLYVIGFELGFGPIPWTIATELTHSSELATVQAIAASLNGIANFIIALIFPFMQKSMQAWVYLPFIIVIFLTIVFVQRVVPETKGLRVEQVCKILRGEQSETESADEGNISTSGESPPQFGRYKTSHR